MTLASHENSKIDDIIAILFILGLIAGGVILMYVSIVYWGVPCGSLCMGAGGRGGSGNPIVIVMEGS